MDTLLSVFQRRVAAVLAAVFLLGTALPTLAYSPAQYRKFQAGIIDHRARINPRFKKIKRKQTRYVIVHTSELGLSATLRVVSKGKRLKSGRRTPGGHANYVIARDGRTYRILDKAYRADHAGLSMWEGRTNVSSLSVGIEVVGYHYAPMTDRQYRSLTMLLDILQSAYRIPDSGVLTHSQVAYGRPNPWFKRNHRGRKRCAKNFDRARAGLKSGPTYDPDVRAGRLQADPELAQLFYGPARPVRRVATRQPKPDSNVISKQRSAWSIAGGDYNLDSTVYVFPDGRRMTGDRVQRVLGWDRIPLGTRILLNQQEEDAMVTQAPGALKTITSSTTAWSIAGSAYRASTTFYFLPNGRTAPGTRIRDWDDLPRGTQVLVGYSGPHYISASKTAYAIAGQAYKSPRTIYGLPGRGAVPGNKIRDFSDLDKGTGIYLPLKKR